MFWGELLPGELLLLSLRGYVCKRKCLLCCAA